MTDLPDLSRGDAHIPAHNNERAAINALKHLTETGRLSAVVLKWAPRTAYASGTPVMAPDGTIVRAKTDFVTGNSYVASNWTTALLAVGTQGQADLDSKYVQKSDFPKLPSFTKATLPSASPAAQMIYVVDEVGGPTPAFSDGTNWRRFADRAVVA